MAENKTATPGTAWLVESQVVDLGNSNSATGKKITLATQGKFLDRNIEIAAPTATISDAVVTTTATQKAAGSATMTAGGFTATDTVTDYYVNLTTASGTATATTAVTTNGYAKASNGDSKEVSVEVSGNGTKVYIPTATVTATATQTTQPTVTLGLNTAGTNVQTATEGTYKVTIDTTKTAGEAKATAGTSGVGMVSSTTSAEKTVTTTVADIENKTVFIKAGAIGNAAGNDATIADYKENTTVIVPSEGYLTLTEGYYPATKISLDQMIEGNPDVITAIAATDMLAGSVAYNVDGKKITGTIPTVTASVSATDGQTVTVPAGYIKTAQEVSVANGSVKLGDAVKTENFVVTASPSDQTITISEGYLKNKTITVKGSATGDAATIGVELGKAGAETIDNLTVGAADVTAGTVAITAAAKSVSTPVTAKTTTSGYATEGTTKSEAVNATGTVSVNATLPLFTGAYTVE